MAAAAAAIRNKFDFAGESILGRDLARLNFPTFKARQIAEIVDDPETDWTDDQKVKKIQLECDMHKFFSTIKRSVKQYGLDLCFEPAWDIANATAVCTTAAQRVDVKGELYTLLIMVCGGDASLVIEGVDDENGAAAITALWDNNTVVTALSRDFAKKFLEITVCFPADSSPQIALSKIQFLIQFSNNFDDEDQIGSTRYKSLLIEIAGRSGPVYESLPIFKVNNADVYEATTVQKLRTQIMGLYRLEQEKNKFSKQVTRYKGGAFSGNTETGEKPVEKTKSFTIPDNLSKKNITSMKTALSKEGWVVMSQQQAAHENRKPVGNNGKSSNNSNNNNSKKGCTICLERYGPNWKVSHTTKQHDSDHYKTKNKGNEGFERMNLRTNP